MKKKQGKLNRVLARNVRRRRRSLGITQMQLACILKVTQPRIAELEREDTGNPGLRTVEGLAAALGTSVRRLLEDSEEPEDSAA